MKPEREARPGGAVPPRAETSTERRARQNAELAKANAEWQPPVDEPKAVA